MSEENRESTQGWTTKRKSVVILSVIKGETSVGEAAHLPGPSGWTFYDGCRHKPQGTGDGRRT